MSNNSDNTSEHTTAWTSKPTQPQNSATHSQENSLETGMYAFAKTPLSHTDVDSGATPIIDYPKAYGRYEVREVVGKGGFGTVFVGYDTKLGRKVAIKVPHGTPTESQCEAFLKEAQRLAQLHDPGILAVHDVGVQDGHIYIVTDFVEGVSLRERLKARPITWEESATIVAKLADALGHAHAQRVIHRDVKPANVLLKLDGNPVLLDFGLALSEREVLSGGPDLRITGTPAYMSPEQARGKGHRIDGRTDIYSLGVVLYRMLTGRLPFLADSVPEMLRRIIEEAPQPPRQLIASIPAEMERICLKAMSRRIEDRYTTALDMAEDLRRACLPQVQGRPSPDDLEHSTKLQPAKPRPAAEPERRRLSLLVCNCESRDLDSPLELLDPEAQHGVQIAFRRCCAEVVERFGGTIVPSGAREVFVCFGFPIAHEDAAARAVRTGMALLDAVARLGALELGVQGVSLTAWAAVHTGQSVVSEGDAGKGETISIVGEARNVATRLESLAEAGVVLVTNTTQQLTRGFFVFESRGKQAIKGAPQPLELFRVLRESEARQRFDVDVQAGLTPLIGRDTELSILRDRWEQTAEGMGQVVLLIGEAGLGKSRLIRELKTHVTQDSAAGALSVIEWQCSSYHQNSSLNPATACLERLLRFDHDVIPTERFSRLVTHLKERGQERAETIALFAALLSVPLDGKSPPLKLSPQRQREKTHECLLDWLRSSAKKQPIVFIVEDLHWIDPSTLELLRALVERGTNDRILTLLTFRPEFETPWKSKAHQTQIALNRLTKRQIGDMMRKKIGRDRLPQSVIDELAAKTDGIPLFVEEFTKVLMESHASSATAMSEMDESSSVFRLHEIPANLEDLLLARLDRMASNREVVQLGATLGREFAYELMRAVCSLDEASLRAELDKLVQAEMLFQKGRPPQCSYLFKHALIQDAAYQAMLKKKRQQHHRKIAEVLVEQFPAMAETQPELVAQHFAEAELSPQSIDWWLRAGQRSSERSALVEAIRQFTRGLELLETLAPTPERDVLELTFRLPLSACYIGNRGYGSPEVEKQTDRARQLCEQLGSNAPLFHVLMVIWALRFIRGKLELADGTRRELLTLAEATDDDSYRTEAHWASCCNTWWAGNFAESRSHSEKAGALWRMVPSIEHARFTQQNSGPLATAYHGLSLWTLGYPEQAQLKMDEALTLAERLNHPFTTAVTLWKAGMMTQLAGDGPATWYWSERVLKISEEQSFAFWIALGIGLKGAALTLQGQHEEAVPILREAIARMEATGCEKVHQSHLYFLAEALWNTGQREAAWAALNRCFAINDRDQERYLEAELYRQKARFLTAEPASEGTDVPGQVEACLNKALEVARRQEARFFELRAALALARLWQAAGRIDDARQLVQPLVDWFTEGLQMPDLIRAREFLRAVT